LNNDDLTKSIPYKIMYWSEPNEISLKSNDYFNSVLLS